MDCLIWGPVRTAGLADRNGTDRAVQNPAVWIPVSVGGVIFLDGKGAGQVMIDISSMLDLLTPQLQVIRELINSCLNMGY